MTKSQFRKKYASKTSLFQESHTGQAEIKNRDIVNNAGVLPAGPNWTAPTLCNQIQQGTDSNNRLGRRYTNTSFGYRITIAATTPGTRVLVIWDKSPNGLAPVVNDILETDNFNSMMRLANADRFIVVSDKIYKAAIDGTPSNLIGNFYKKMALETVCNNTGAAVADISTGALWVLACNPAPVAVSNFQIFTRIRFRDA